MMSKPPSTTRRSTIRTFLIADIRGWTRFTRELGDEAASRLAAKFAQIVGEGVEAWGGRLLELRGDEAMCTFESARRALRCAVELQEAFADESALAPELALNVGIGLDAGEAVPVGDGYRGTALNVAARLCATADAGAVIATAGLAHLAGRVEGLTFADLDAQPMKGFDQPVPAVLVDSATPHEHDAPVARPSTEATTPPLPPELDPVVPLIARNAEVRWLSWHWRRARHGHGGVVGLTGAPGMGCTRLVAELAAIAHRDGAVVTYLSGEEVPVPPDDASLVIVDDLDRMPDRRARQLFRGLAAGLEGRLLVAVEHVRDRAADAPAIERLIPPDRVHRLGPIDVDGVVEISRLYLVDPGTDVPAQLLLEESDGIPAEIHRVASQWARATASRKLGESARRTSRERRELRAAEATMIDDVERLENARERTRLFVPLADPPVDEPSASSRLVCPYKGLAAFDAADADYFFGRERLIAELVARMVGSSFIGLVGASGSGKSSTLQAGLLPSLAAGVIPGSDEWTQVSMRPGDHPMAELQASLARHLADQPAIAADPASTIEAALAALRPAQRLLLVVDQFEELFRVRDGDERAAFVDLLTTPRTGMKVLVSLRADQYERCAAYPRLARLIGAEQVLVGPMSTEELRSVIRHPAERSGLRVDAELVDVLVADVSGEPGGLPLLSTALLELWETRDDGRMTLAAYRATGGVRGAVARLAEGVYGRLDVEQQAVARTIFLRLAGEGEGGVIVRRRVRLEELDVVDRPETAETLAALTSGRLVTAADGFVEVAHEALLREWPRLRGWIEEDSAGRELRLHLMEAARTWDQGGREEGDLYRGARLGSTLDWSAEHAVELNAVERAFVEQSRAASEEEAESQRRTNRRLRGLLVGAAVLLLVATGAGAFAMMQSAAADRQRALAEDQAALAAGEAARADQEARLARASELYAGAVATVERDPELTILLADAARQLGVEPTAEAVSALHLAVARQRSVRTIELPPTDPRPTSAGVALSPDGETLYAATNSASVDAYAVATGERTRRFGTARSDLLLGYLGPVISPDGNRLAIIDEEGTLHLWDIATGEERTLATGGQRANWSVFNQDGSRLAAITHLDEADYGENGEEVLVTLVDVERGAITQSWKVLDAWSVSFGPDPDRLHLTACPCLPDYTVVDLHVTSGEIDVVLGRIEAIGETSPTSAKFTPDGAHLVTGSRDGGVYAWDAATGEHVATYAGHAGQVTYLVMSPDGERVATTSVDGSTKVWEVLSGDLLMTLTGQGGIPGFAAFSADGTRLATGSSNLTARVWDLTQHRGEVAAYPLGDQFDEIWELDVDGATLGVLGAPSACDTPACPLAAAVIDTATGGRYDIPRNGLGLAVLPGGGHVVSQRAIPDPSSERGWTDGPIVAFDAEAGTDVLQFEGVCEKNPFGGENAVCEPPPSVPWHENAFAFAHSADGSLIAMVGISGAVAVWNDDGELVTGPLVLPTVFTVHLAMSPDAAYLAVSTLDEVFVLDPATLEEITRLPVSIATGLRFSPDSSRLLVSSGTTETRLYRTEDWSFDQIGVFSAASDFGPDGERFVTLDVDGTIRLWGIGSAGQPAINQAIPVERMHFRNYGGAPKGFVRFVGDDHVATVDSGGVAIYTTDIDELFDAALRSVTRGLTDGECETHLHGPCPTTQAAGARDDY